MKTGWKWLLLGGGALIVVFLLALPFVGGAGWANCGRLGYGGFGPGKVGGGYSMMGFGFLPMLGMGLVLLTVVALGVVGVVALLRNTRGSAPAPMPGTPVAPAGPVCANCGQAVQTGWVACPQCGQKL